MIGVSLIYPNDILYVIMMSSSTNGGLHTNVIKDLLASLMLILFTGSKWPIIVEC